MEKNQMKTGKKVIQRHIYTEAWGKSLVKVMQKQLIDPVASVVTDLKSAVNDFDARLTSYERTKKIDIAGRFYAGNGTPPAGLTRNLFRGNK